MSPSQDEIRSLQTDLSGFRQIMQAFFTARSADDWSKRAGSRDKDWTLQQATAHVVTIAYAFNQLANAAAHGTPVTFEGLTRREDLRAWNAAEIAKRAQVAGHELANQLDSALNEASTLLNTLSLDQLENTVDFPVYNQPASAWDFLDWQLSHAGVIHAAQLPKAVSQPPLWDQYPAEMLPRQVGRFLRHWAVAYWPEYGDGETHIMNMQIGQAGHWHLIGSPDGGQCLQGESEDADYAMHFDSPQTLFGIFTVQRDMREAISTGALTIYGDMREVFNFVKLFSPTPPK